MGEGGGKNFHNNTITNSRMAQNKFQGINKKNGGGGRGIIRGDVLILNYHNSYVPHQTRILYEPITRNRRDYSIIPKLLET